MLWHAFYAKNYAGIIGTSLATDITIYFYYEGFDLSSPCAMSGH